jgi:hypothetical protein
MDDGHEPDSCEKGIRFGCGFLAGTVVAFFFLISGVAAFSGIFWAEVFGVALIFAYLIGSIPTSVWLGKFYHGIDIREHGSGNAGATNTFRIFGVFRNARTPVLIAGVVSGVSHISGVMYHPPFPG